MRMARMAVAATLWWVLPGAWAVQPDYLPLMAGNQWICPYFGPLGWQVYYCGRPGMGRHAKVTQKLFLSNVLQAFCVGFLHPARRL